jgi:hypothetical protein
MQNTVAFTIAAVKRLPEPEGLISAGVIAAEREFVKERAARTPNEGYFILGLKSR